MSDEIKSVDAVVVGAGFSGMFAIYKLRELGFSVQGFERGSDVGGTWYWNRYPGARCDAPSLQYSYQFSDALQQDWHWTEKYAAQPEILDYCQHVAERFDLRKHIAFDTTVKSIHFDELEQLWTLRTNSDDCYVTRFCIMATGCLSTTNTPNIPGIDEFGGEQYHTGRWPQEGVELAGKRVGVIGTGSTGIQVITTIADEVAELFVFQRTAQYSTPAHNEPTDPEYEAAIKQDYANFRAANYRRPLAIDIQLDPQAPKTFDVSDDERRAEYEKRWQEGGMALLLAYRDSTLNQAANETISEFIKEKIDEIVEDKELARTLKPKHIYGCKRPCIDTGYFEVYNRDNVTLVDASQHGIERITQQGVMVNGQEYPLDCLIFATGFDAMIGTLNRIDIRGIDGLELKDKWLDGPRNYLGLVSRGFPNMFFVAGPGSPSVLTNMVATSEKQVNWIGDCMAYMRDEDIALIDASADAEENWLHEVQQAAERTLWSACDNWYYGANIPGKPRVFMPYVDWPTYMSKVENVIENDYKGFELIGKTA
ncbi:MAG: flavin-containing monooxygenase [Gammaproteobacteria bacterium]